MASPTARTGATRAIKRVTQLSSGLRLDRLPLAVRRGSAWIIEVSLIAVSAVVPFQAGLYANHLTKPVPLNPLLVSIEKSIAQTLAMPIAARNQKVAPLTNLLWSGALLMPLALAGSQLYLLAKTGRTLPKAWLGIEVTTVGGAPPGLAKVLVREGLGRWGLPLGTAYLIWRYSGAFPALGILAVLGGLLLFAEGATLQFDRQRRALHDRLAGTYVIDRTAPIWQSHAEVMQADGTFQAVYLAPLEENDSFIDEDWAIAAIVLAPAQPRQRQGLWRWIARRPGTALVGFSLATLILVLGTFVGTQVYVQNQTNWRESQQQKDQIFLALVNRLTTSASLEDRRTAILTLATLDDSRATPLLSDLLSQETNPTLIDTLQQALVSLGPETLPYLQKLNQALSTEFASLQPSRDRQERITALRLRATQQAITKILTLYSGQISSMNLSRIDLGRVMAPPAPFTLVLDQTDLSGLVLRGAKLTGASLRGSRLSGAGEDDRLGTYDDWIADLSGADLKAADLTGALLNRALFQRANLTGAIFNKADLASAQMSGANLSNASLIETNLHQATLERVSLTGANLGNANLSEANLQNALLGQVRAVGANLQSADLSQSDWRGADLSRADLRRSNLQNADLSSSLLLNADLRDAQIQNANLRGANLSSANLQGANLDGADLQGAIFALPARTGRDQFIKIDPIPEENNLLRAVDFSRARSLSEQQINYICFQGGLHPQCP